MNTPKEYEPIIDTGDESTRKGGVKMNEMEIKEWNDANDIAAQLAKVMQKSGRKSARTFILAAAFFNHYVASNMETSTSGEITAKMVLARIFGEGRAIELSDRARKRGVEE